MVERTLQGKESKMGKDDSLKMKDVANKPVATPAAPVDRNRSQMVEYIMSTDKVIQFLPAVPGINDYSGMVGQNVEIEIGMTNGIGDVNTLNSDDTVEAYIISGAGAIQGSASVKFAAGRVKVSVKGNGAGEVKVGLQNPSKSVDVTDVAKITYN